MRQVAVLIPEEREFKDWLAHPVTQAYRKALRMALEGVKEQWANGAFQVFDGSDALNTTIANASALAEVRTYERLMDLDYEQFTLMLEEEDDKSSSQKPNGPGTNGPRPAVRAV